MARQKKRPSKRGSRQSDTLSENDKDKLSEMRQELERREQWRHEHPGDVAYREALGIDEDAPLPARAGQVGGNRKASTRASRNQRGPV